MSKCLQKSLKKINKAIQKEIFSIFLNRLLPAISHITPCLSWSHPCMRQADSCLHCCRLWQCEAFGFSASVNLWGIFPSTVLPLSGIWTRHQSSGHALVVGVCHYSMCLSICCLTLLQALSSPISKHLLPSSALREYRLTLKTFTIIWPPNKIWNFLLFSLFIIENN